MTTNASQDDADPMEAEVARPPTGRHPSLTSLASCQLNDIAPCWGLAPNSDPSREPIFVCIDCEAYMHKQSEVTEVGVAVLDSRDVQRIVETHRAKALSAGALDYDFLFKTIVSKMKHAHYRPVEYWKRKNRGYLQGCEDRFKFGTSTWIRLVDAPKVMLHVLTDPANLDTAADFSMQRGTPEVRNVVLVGHDVGGDVKYLRTLCVETHTAGIGSKFDTQRQCYGPQLGLDKLLVAMGIRAVNLHNGGNDAAYTLMAMVKMVLFEHQTVGMVIELTKAVRDKPKPATEYTDKAPVGWGGTARIGDEKKAYKDAVEVKGETKQGASKMG